MKCSLNESIEPDETLFPVLARSANGNTIVLFDSGCSGMILSSDGAYQTGEYCYELISVHHEDYWVILPKGVTVTLEND